MSIVAVGSLIVLRQKMKATVDLRAALNLMHALPVGGPVHDESTAITVRRLRASYSTMRPDQALAYIGTTVLKVELFIPKLP